MILSGTHCISAQKFEIELAVPRESARRKQYDGANPVLSDRIVSHCARQSLAAHSVPFEGSF